MPISHCFLHRTGHKGLNQDSIVTAIFWDHFSVLQHGDTILRHNCTNLVASQQHHLAATIAHGDAHTICIWVSGDDHIRTYFVGLRNRHRKRFGIFRVGRLNGREARVLHHLLRHFDYFDAECFQSRHRANRTRAMNRRKYDLRRFLLQHFMVNHHLFEQL